MRVDLADDHAEVRQGEDVLSASGGFVQATRIGDGIPRAAQQRVLPIGVAQSVSVSAAAGKLP